MTAHSPRVPGRNVWNPGAIDDGSRTVVNERTGEITEVPASKVRALRLGARAEQHQAAVAERAAEQAERNRAGIQAARTALPTRVPIGLERPAT